MELLQNGHNFAVVTQSYIQKLFSIINAYTSLLFFGLRYALLGGKLFTKMRVLHPELDFRIMFYMSENLHINT